MEGGDVVDGQRERFRGGRDGVAVAPQTFAGWLLS